MLDCQQVLIIVKDVTTIVSLGIASIVAIWGLTTWKRQLKGTANYEVAKRLLMATYKLRNSLRAVRNPLILASEKNHALREINSDVKPTEENFNFECTRAVYQIRWKPVIDAIDNLEISSLEAEAIWGPSIINEIVEIKKKPQELFVALYMYLQDLDPRSLPLFDNVSRIKFEQILYESYDPKNMDTYSKELNNAVTNLERKVKQFLASKG